MTWWQWLLVITAAFVVAMVILVTALIAWVKSKFRNFAKGLQGLAALGANPIPETLTLVKCDETEIDKRENLRTAIDQVRSLGFEIDGPYYVDDGKTIVTVLTAKPDEQVSGTISAAPNRAVVVDFVTVYEDENSLTTTTLEDQGLDRPIQHRFSRHPDLSPAELLDVHRKDRSDKPRLTLNLAQTRERARQFVEEEWFWRATRGGLTDAELDRQIARQPQPIEDEPGDAPIDPKFNQKTLLRSMIRGRAQGFLEDLFRKTVLQDTQLSAADWEDIEDRLLFVYDAADAERLAYHLIASDDNALATQADIDGATRRQKAIEAELSQGPLRDAFARLAKSLPPTKRLQLLQTVRIPRKLATAIADVYVAPKYEDGVDV